MTPGRRTRLIKLEWTAKVSAVVLILYPLVPRGSMELMHCVDDGWVQVSRLGLN